MRGLAIALVAALVSGACGGAPAPVSTDRAVLVLRPAGPRSATSMSDGTPIAWVEVVADPLTRQRGLMERTSLPRDGGMLFVYPEAAPRSFWMKNTTLPLSGAFLDDDGRILNIERMAPTDNGPDHGLPRYRSAGDARYVLEMEQGWFRARGIGPGDRIELAPALAGVRVR